MKSALELERRRQRDPRHDASPGAGAVPSE